MKKSLSLMLSFLMLISSFPALAFNVNAEEISGNAGKDCTYYYNSETRTLTFKGRPGSSGGVVDEDFSYSSFNRAYKLGIEKIVFDSKVTAIEFVDPFEDLYELKEIVFTSVNMIPYNCFRRCDVLEKISIGSAYYIGYDAFIDCPSLTAITIPNSVTYIGDYAFGYKHTDATLDPFNPNYDELYAPIDNEVTLTSSCNNEGVQGYISNNPQIKWKKTHTFSKTGTIKKKAAIAEDGEMRYYCVGGCGRYRKSTITRISKVKISRSKYTYSGVEKKPSPIVTDANGKKLKSGTDYTYYYKGNNKKVGRFRIYVDFKGKYCGGYNTSAYIFPCVPKIKSMKGKSKKIEVKWNALPKEACTKYEFQVSTAPFSKKKGYKVYYIKNSPTKKATLGGLKKKTKYYVRMRAHCETDNTTYSSEWTETWSGKTTK